MFVLQLAIPSLLTASPHMTPFFFFKAALFAFFFKHYPLYDLILNNEHIVPLSQLLHARSVLACSCEKVGVNRQGDLLNSKLSLPSLNSEREREREV